jgi:probable HAF family extracellular repeat protein
VYDLTTQAFTPVIYPHTSYTVGTAINNAGAVVGQVAYRTSDFGFELIGSSYRPITPPGAIYSQATGITTAGEVVGFVTNTSGYANYRFVHGKYQPIKIPNAAGAQVYGVNLAGTAVVGFYGPTSVSGSGFVYQNNILTTLQFPETSYTVASGINSAGEVVGQFGDANGVHGFLWTPSSDATKP